MRFKGVLWAMSGDPQDSLLRFQSLHAALEEGVSRYNCGDFLECHEVLEEVWLVEDGDDKAFLQGLIKIAAGFHHYRRGTFRGMFDLLRAGREVLGPFRPAYQGVELTAFLRAVDSWVIEAEKLLNGEMVEEETEIPPLVYQRPR